MDSSIVAEGSGKRGIPTATPCGPDQTRQHQTAYSRASQG
jgi:hypothetical protein